MSAAAVATIFGMKVSVISLICVSAWKMLTLSPATSPKRSTGPARARVSSSALRPMAMTVSTVMSLPSSSAEALHERAGEHVPAVDQDEEHQLERQRDEDGRQRDHAHRGQDRRDHHVEDQERHVDEKAHLEGRLQLGDEEGGQQRLRRDVVGAVGSRGAGGADEERQILLARL